MSDSQTIAAIAAIVIGYPVCLFIGLRLGRNDRALESQDEAMMEQAKLDARVDKIKGDGR